MTVYCKYTTRKNGKSRIHIIQKDVQRFEYHEDGWNSDGGYMEGWVIIGRLKIDLPLIDYLSTEEDGVLINSDRVLINL